MLINKDSRGWILACVLFLAGAGIVYFALPGMGQHRLDGPSGGTPEGLVLGVAGYAMMLFALLLGARKRVRTLRIGKAYWWTQGHVWLGTISFPIILLHGGFKENFWGGVLTQWIMWLFVIVWLSGIVGIILQQFMPNRMLNNVPMETIYEQIDTIIAKLRNEADRIIKGVEERMQSETYDAEVAGQGGTAVASTAAASVRVGTEAETKLITFYRTQVQPVLNERIPAGAILARERQSIAAFGTLRDTMPTPLKKPVDDLSDIVEERRQLAKQKRLHHGLHGWLFVHVPLSYALMALATVHAFQALRYTSSPVWVFWVFAVALAIVLIAMVALLLVGRVKARS